MRSFQVSFLLLTCITLFGNAHAMCGGGGWKGGANSTHTNTTAPAATANGTTPATTTTNPATTTQQSNSTAAPTPTTQAAPHEVVYQSAPIVPAVHAPAVQNAEQTYFPASAFLDTSRLDAVSTRLNLSDDQKSRIASAKQSVSQQSETLNQSRAKAERLFDACNGECESQRYRLRRATDAADRYSPNTEFNTQLRTILDTKQIAIYDGREEVSTAK